MRLVSIKCPECNAPLSIEADAQECTCQYCGAKILLYDGASYTYRKIDEARINESNTKRDIKLRELDIKEKFTRLIYFLIIIGCVCLAIGFLGLERVGYLGYWFFIIAFVIWKCGQKK